MMRLHPGVHVRRDALRWEGEGARYVAVGVECIFGHLNVQSWSKIGRMIQKLSVR